MKEFLENSGYEEGRTGSPKQILKTAYKANMIEDENLWLDAMVSRNNVAHAYNKDIALDIVNRTKTDYYTLFEKLIEELEKNWL